MDLGVVDVDSQTTEYVFNGLPTGYIYEFKVILWLELLGIYYTSIPIHYTLGLYQYFSH